jgi:DNA processing protein
MEQNREVFAVPGLISNPQSAGCHQLIRQGAKLVESMADILEEFPHLDTKSMDQFQKAFISSQSTDTDSQNLDLNDSIQEKILRSLKSQPCLLDTLALETNIEINELIERLLVLESRGTISLESGRYHYCGR